MLQIVKAKTCQYCYHAKEAAASSRTILICDRKYGAERKFFVIAPNQTCSNFKPTQTPPSLSSDGARLIPLTQGKFAIVDADDYGWLAKYKWYSYQDGNTFYAFRRKGRKRRRSTMHREIMHAPEGLLVDHKDRNGLNNRKSNLRLCSPAQNAWNRRPAPNCHSKYKGVTWHKHHNKWHVRIFGSGKNYYLGSFDDETEAALAYDRKAEEFFGEFAYLNFPQPQITQIDTDFLDTD